MKDDKPTESQTKNISNRVGLPMPKPMMPWAKSAKIPVVG